MMITKNRRGMYVLLFFITISIFLENIKLFSVLGTEFKPTHVIFICAVIATILSAEGRQIKRRNLIAMLFFAILPMIPMYRINDTLEWFKSYVIWIIAVVYLGVALPYIYDFFQEYREKLIKIFLYGMVIIQILALLQFVFMNLMGVMFLQDVFGPFQYISSYVSAKSGIYRAFSIFHEPSVLGWVNTTGLAVFLYVKDEGYVTKRFTFVFYVLSAATMLVSMSSTGMYIFFILVIIYLLMNSKKKSGIMGIIIVAVVLIYLWFGTSVLNPMKRLFTEYNTVNSSGYERFNVPLQYVMKTLSNYPLFGRGIGQEGDIDAVGIISTANSTAANNSVFQIFMNFGLSALFIIAIFIRSMWRGIKRNKAYLFIAINLLGVLIGTGAYLSLDFLAVLNISLLVMRPVQYCEEYNDDAVGIE